MFASTKKYLSSVGNDERYISIESGANAVTNPRAIVKVKLFIFVKCYSTFFVEFYTRSIVETLKPSGFCYNDIFTSIPTPSATLLPDLNSSVLCRKQATAKTTSLFFAIQSIERAKVTSARIAATESGNSKTSIKSNGYLGTS